MRAFYVSERRWASVPGGAEARVSERPCSDLWITFDGDVCNVARDDAVHIDVEEHLDVGILIGNASSYELGDKDLVGTEGERTPDVKLLALDLRELINYSARQTSSIGSERDDGSRPERPVRIDARLVFSVDVAHQMHVLRDATVGAVTSMGTSLMVLVQPVSSLASDLPARNRIGMATMTTTAAACLLFIAFPPLPVSHTVGSSPLPETSPLL